MHAADSDKKAKSASIETNIAVVKALHLFELRLLHHADIPTTAFDAITAVREQMTDELPICPMSRSQQLRDAAAGVGA